MPKINEPLDARLQFMCTPALKQKFEARCASLGLDKPAAARMAIALFVERGIDYGPKIQPVKTEQAGG